MVDLSNKKKSAHTAVGAGRASGAVALELVTFAKTSSSHIALLGGFWSPGVLRFAVPAMGISFLKMYFWMIFGYALPSLPWGLALEEILVFDWFFVFILLRLEGHWGERFGGIAWGCF